MRRVYKGDIPRNVKKAFAERIRYARLKGETNTDEYKHIMELRAKGEITLDIAQNALRKRKKKVSHETLSVRDLMNIRKQKWIDKGLEYSTQYQSMLKKSMNNNLSDDVLNTLFKDVDGYEEKQIRLNSLLEEHKEYIYKGATEGSEPDEKIFEDIMEHTTTQHDNMFDENNIDKYINKLELYGKNKTELLNKYFGGRKNENSIL